MILPITLAFASLNALIFIFLSILVVRGRFKERVSVGAGGKTSLELKIRAHGNFAEYVPLALFLLALLEANDQPQALLCLLGTALTVGRISHAIGLRTVVAPNPFRFVGTLLTWVMITVAAVMGLYLTLIA